ncbi:ribosomal protein S18-alanine N-acetyltransferase [Colwellia sp. MB02u-6]|uniref:ribosomal protein S18-alanine N-acetyltransferase n=1 Tax=Colwellia sp. MB02u-6 TaxID=2759824 RepID=UPI0015F6D57E|nr:ribosomal protein S18-alanine N-acetyltransferase [Colwellia sp. MB02u-6]MBA6327922.1 ribosomal protein S18-alanine N-acetyltransferase [Colwellia sp. MB02u-6]
MKKIINTTFTPVHQDIVEQLMVIELACHPHPWSEKTFRSCISGRYFGDYLTIDNSIVGFYVGEFILGEATLMDICVMPEQQGKGYGKALLLQFFTYCKTLATDSIFLEVRAKNISAQMLYINQGFTEISRRTGYYPSNTGFGYEDAIVMSKKLK